MISISGHCKSIRRKSLFINIFIFILFCLFFALGVPNRLDAIPLKKHKVFELYFHAQITFLSTVLRKLNELKTRDERGKATAVFSPFSRSNGRRFAQLTLKIDIPFSNGAVSLTLYPVSTNTQVRLGEPVTRIDESILLYLEL